MCLTARKSEKTENISMMICSMKNDDKDYTFILNNCFMYFSKSTFFFFKKKKMKLIDFGSQIERIGFWFSDNPSL